MPFGFTSPELLTSLKCDNATTLGEQAFDVLQHIDSKIGEETKAILIEELKIVLMEKYALHFLERIELGASSSAHIM